MRIDSTECNDESENSSFESDAVPVFLLLDSAGETVALVAHDGLDALLDMDQHLGVKGSSATAGGKSMAKPLLGTKLHQGASQRSELGLRSTSRGESTKSTARRAFTGLLCTRCNSYLTHTNHS